MTIQELVNQYKLKHDGFEFWAPYWTNESGTPEGIFAGKGRPHQLQAKLGELAAQYIDPLENAEAVRYFMLRNGLGVDCSGFAYHLLDEYLKQQKGTELAQHLYIGKAEILQALSKPSWQGKVDQSEVEGWPENVPMSQVCKTFGKDPIYITNVKRLCQPQATVEVRQSELQPGDMIHISYTTGDHVMVVVEASEDSLSYAESKFDPVGPGGILITEATKSDLKINSKYPVAGLRRLKALA